jgi:DNA ligase-associated metallophosphoesterase
VTTTILAAGRPLTLLAEKAAFLAASRTLLVADAHIGKAVSFRALGVPVPRGTTSETLAALSALIATWRARRVVFLGDFLQSARAHAAATLGAVARWRREHASLELVLVRGNHDDRAGDPPPYLGMRVVDEPLELDGFAMCHHPSPRRGAYVLAGHLHPCIGLGGRGFDHLRLPCFWLGDDVGVLPAFGAFTGMHPIRAGAEDRVFAIADGAVTAMRSRAVAETGDRCAA